MQQDGKSNLKNAVFLADIIEKYNIIYIDFEVDKTYTNPYATKKIKVKNVLFHNGDDIFTFVQDNFKLDWKTAALFLLTFEHRYFICFFETCLKKLTNLSYLNNEDFQKVVKNIHSIEKDFYTITNKDFDEQIENQFLHSDTEKYLFKKHYIHKHVKNFNN